MSQGKALELDLQLDLRKPGAPVGLIRRGPQQMRAILVPPPPRKPIGVTVSTTEFPELSHICDVPALLLQVAGSIDLIDRKMPTRSGTIAANFDLGHKTLTVEVPAQPKISDTSPIPIRYDPSAFGNSYSQFDMHGYNHNNQRRGTAR